MISPAAILLITSGSSACHMMLGYMHEAEMRCLAMPYPDSSRCSYTCKSFVGFPLGTPLLQIHIHINVHQLSHLHISLFDWFARSACWED